MAEKRSTLSHKGRLNVKRNKRREHKVHFMSRHQEGSQNLNKNLLKKLLLNGRVLSILCNTPGRAAGLSQPLIE